jgi:hypothetical protein
MFDGKFICTLTALIVAVIAICNYNPHKNTSVIEGLGMLPSFTVRANALVKNSKGRVSALQRGTQALADATSGVPMGSGGLSGAVMSGNIPGVDGNATLSSPEFYSGPRSSEFFMVPPTFQSSIAPRFANTQFGSNINYNAPAYKYMGVPKSPLGYANMAKENYSPTKESYGCGGCGDGSCFAADCDVSGRSKSPKSCEAGNAQPQMAADYANGDYHKVANKAIREHPVSDGFTNTLPIASMSSLNNMGEDLGNVIMYDRLIYSNRNSRTRGQGDPIRGDLAIVPCSTGWFQVSADPLNDLQQGAMAVMGGVNPNSSSGKVAALINNTTGISTIGGVNMSTQELASLGASGGDLMYTAFP